MRKHDGGRQIVSLLASCVVVFLGVLACLVVVLASSPDPGKHLAWLGGGALGLIFLIWWLNRPADRERPVADWLYWKLYGGQHRPKQEFQVKLVKPAVEDWTPRKPPTVEEIRNLKEESSNTWVPSQSPPKRDFKGRK